MNRYEFEDKISDYLDNNLNISERQAFEKYVKESKDAEILLNSVKHTIELVRKQSDIKTSENFMLKLSDRIKSYKKTPLKSIKRDNRNFIFGFSPKNSALMGVFVFSFVYLLLNIAPEANSLFQSNIVSSKKSVIDKDIPQSPKLVDNKMEFVSVDSSQNAINSKEKINLKDKIKLVKNKR